MVPIYLYEDSHFDHLYPLTLTRPASLLACGTMTLLARAQAYFGSALSGILVRPGLTDALKHRINLPVNPAVSTREGVLLINSRWLLSLQERPEDPDWSTLFPARSAGLVSGAIAWIHLDAQQASEVQFSLLHQPKTLESQLPFVDRRSVPATLINRPWDLITHQPATFLADWPHFGPAQLGAVAQGVFQIEMDKIHIGKNVRIAPLVVLDASKGPIILEGSEDPAHATVVEPHSVITGPCYIGPECLIRAHSDIRSDTYLGHSSRVGGEINNCIFLGYSNKQHLGFLGQTIVGQWANLGAGTTTSNLKNTYGDVRLPINGRAEASGRTFMGSVIADHAKLGIGTYLSTGSVIGFASHVTVPRPPKFVPSFAWVTSEGPGTGGGMQPVPYHIGRIDFEKVTALAKLVMSRRNVEYTLADHELFVRIAGEYANREAFDWDAHSPRFIPPESP